MERWTYEYDNGNIYVLYRGKVKAHFWDLRLAKEYIKLKTGQLISIPRVKKAKPIPGRRPHNHFCPTCKADWWCKDRGCDGGIYRYCDQHTALRKKVDYRGFCGECGGCLQPDCTDIREGHYRCNC